MDRIGRREK